MRDRILAEATWLTASDAARLLQMTRFGVHYLARSGQLAFERTFSGQRLFRYGLVRKLANKRAEARMRRRGEYLAAVRVRMLKALAAGEARQLSLDFSARLQLVGARGKGRKVA